MTGRETEAIRVAFAELRALAASADGIAEQQVLRDCCRRLIASPAESDLLSEREVDVLAHVATGLQNGEIAAALGVSAETVKSYLRSALAKLGAHSRLQSVEVARQAGLLP
ncbi:hypothetical protein ASD30_00170 [Nocardioides sp. Root140]|nr:hypothetical protein ASD30_00170 [Nocardioides sp. Root140]